MPIDNEAATAHLSIDNMVDAHNFAEANWEAEEAALSGQIADLEAERSALLARIAELEAQVPPAEEEPPPPPPTGKVFAFGLSEADIRSLPQTGPEWNNVKAMADRVLTFDPSDGALDGSGNAFCAGLVYVATGDVVYKNKVTTILQQIETNGPVNWWHAAANRKAGGWALASELVGYDSPTWPQFLRDMLFVAHAGHNRSGVMFDCAGDWDNNHGSAARASAACIAAVLKDQALLDSVARFSLGWLGDHTAYPHQDSTSPTGALGITDPPLSRTWQHNPAQPYGIVPTSLMVGEPVDSRKEGAVPSDVIRENASFPNIGGSTHYIFGNAGRMTNAAVILAANGYPNIWDVADEALYRWRAWTVRNGVQAEGAGAAAHDPVLNKVYLADYPAKVSGTGETITGTDWLVLHPGFPVR